MKKTLRLQIERMVDKEWEPVDNGSVCTRVPRDTPDKVLFTLLSGKSIKRATGTLSGMEPCWVDGLPDDARQAFAHA